MRPDRYSITALTACGLFLLAGAGWALADPKGLWEGSDGGLMRISACVPALCSHLVGMTAGENSRSERSNYDRSNSDGRFYSDSYRSNADSSSNPDSRPNPREGKAGKRAAANGVQVLINMRPNGPNKWSGKLFNSRDGNTYDGNLIELGPTSIRVEGCALGLCGGQSMTRVR